MKNTNKKFLYVAVGFALLLAISPMILNVVGGGFGAGKYNKACEASSDGYYGGLELAKADDAYYDEEMCNSVAYDPDVNYEEKAMSDYVVAGSRMGSSEQEMPAKKIIENYYLSMQSEHFDEVMDSIKQFAEEEQGFIKSFDVNGNGTKHDRRRANLEIKIPAEKSGSYIDSITELCKVVSKSKNIDDVTKVYGDIMIEIRNYEEAEKRYLELYKKADTIEDMLLVENELSRLRNEIDTRKAQIKNYDYLVSYSTITLYVEEVVEEKEEIVVEPNVWQKAKNGFIESVNAVIEGAQGLFIGLVSIVPMLLVALVIIVIVVIIVKSKSKKKSKKSDVQVIEDKASEE